MGSAGYQGVGAELSQSESLSVSDPIVSGSYDQSRLAGEVEHTSLVPHAPSFSPSDRNCRMYRSAYFPSAASSCSWIPRSTMRPWSMTSI